jgi:Domain of unknown function (DUF4118)
MNAELEPVGGTVRQPRPSATLRRRYRSWWLVPLSSVAWLVLSGILLRVISATAAIVLLAAVFLLSVSDEFLDRARYGFPPRRRLAGHGLAAAMALLLALLLARLHGQLSPSAGVLFLVLGVIAAALAGGLIPAVIEAVAGSLLLRLLVTTQSGKPAIAGASDASILGVLVVLAVVVGVLAEGAAPPSRQIPRPEARTTARSEDRDFFRTNGGATNR